MTSLTDIARASSTVAGVPIYGVSALGIAAIFERFPVVRQLFGGQSVDFSAEMLTKLAPEALAVVIACGVGKPGDRETEAEAANLPLHVQAEMLDAIISLTMPKGAGPFVEMVTRLGATLGLNTANAEAADGSKAPDTNSPKPSNT